MGSNGVLLGFEVLGWIAGVFYRVLLAEGMDDGCTG